LWAKVQAIAAELDIQRRNIMCKDELVAEIPSKQGGM
jgi:hypothetical protein